MEQDPKATGLIRWMLGIAGLGAVAAPLGLPHYGTFISLSVVGLLVILAGGFLLWQSWKRKKEKNQFTSALNQESASAPRGISDPNKRAKLDDLRRRFQEGVGVYESRGKDLYRLPWYVFVGEPGSGKTEAIRRSNIGFPPGLQDEFQGAGGTVNMNWWFSNHGVLLDTAGRLMFEEIKTGESSEWKEFLNLLKKTRPHCPINGLFLVLPVDSLIKDSADKIAQKAGRIAQQMDMIQRTLDVRFPVYVLVTKCDLLTGFREFFDGIEDPQLQHQMMGWSNPEPLDAPFRMDLVDQYLSQVADRLRRRRLGLLRDPVAAEDVSGRRTNEVDALFSLPQSLLLIAPRLRRYLETIFVAGEWATKPVFLRGIYFTSSLREGSDLDEVLAQALGIPVAELPGGRVWEKDRAFFLRDLFVEKAFRESGLVTRATNTSRMLRNRQFALFGCGFGALALLLVWSWLGWTDLNQSIGQESATWRIATNGWNQGLWNPIVRAGPKDPLVFQYMGNEPVPGGGKLTLTEFHRDLKNLAQQRLPVSWVFRPITWLRPSREIDRKLGQRIVFEQSVLQPLIDDTRQKMVERGRRATAAGTTGSFDEAGAARHWAALLSLLQLEADLNNGKKVIGSTNAAQNYLQSFLSYLTDTNLPPPRALVDTFTWTYSPSPAGQGVWPPRRFSGGDSLSANQAIDQGLDQFLAYAKRSQKAQADRLKLLNTIRDQTTEFQRQEALLFRAAEGKKPIAADQMESLTLAKNALHFSLLEAKYERNPGDTGFSLATAYTNLIAESQQTSTNTLSEIYRIMSSGTKPVTEGLYGEIRAKLVSFQSRGVDEILQSLKQAGNLAELDRYFLANYEAKPFFEARWELYQKAYQFGQTRVDASAEVGQQWRVFDEFRKGKVGVQTLLEAYKGGYRSELSTTCNYLLDEGERLMGQRLVQEYALLVTTRLNSLAAQNPGQITLETLQNAKTFLEKVEQDLAGPVLVKVPLDRQATLRPLFEGNRVVKTSLIQGFAKTQDAALGQQIGFPVAFDSANKILTLQEVQKLKGVASALEKAFASPTNLFNFYPPEPIQALRAKIALYAPLLNALIDDNQQARTWKLSVDTKQSDKSSYFRLVTVLNGGQPPIRKDVSGSTQDFGTAPLDQSLEIEIRKYWPQANKPDDPEAKPVNQADDFAEWGAIELIRKYQAKVTCSVDRKTWQVPVPVSDGKMQGTIVFVLTFDQPLPPLADWPVTKTWNP